MGQPIAFQIASALWYNRRFSSVGKSLMELKNTNVPTMKYVKLTSAHTANKIINGIMIKVLKVSIKIKRQTVKTVCLLSCIFSTF